MLGLYATTPAGSLPVWAGKQFAAGRKLDKTHQNVLVFYKGDPRMMKQRFPPRDLLADGFRIVTI